MSLFPLINQDFNRKLLLNTLENDRVANAYLFYGPEGGGHEGFALEFTAMLNCTSNNERPCGKCPSCRKMKTLEHANLQLIFPMPIKKDTSSDNQPFKSLSQSEIAEIQNIIKKKSENPYEKISIPNAKHISINFIREIKRTIYLTSPEKGWKVVIVFDAHLMTEQASNAFLKILEEPPPKSVFILTSSNPSNLIPTIQSRCQPIYFPPLSLSSLESVLSSKEIPESSRRLIISLSSGDLNQAIDLSETDLTKLKESTLEILRSIAVWNIEKIYKLIETLSILYKQEPENFTQLMLSLSFWFRDAAASKIGCPDTELIHSDLKTEISKFVKAFPDFNGFKMNTSVENCIDFIKRNVYINLALLNMFFKIRDAINPGKNK
ncbi:MAG: hypothetical protein KAT41_02820 [Candidatus Marinimicrobia bacterium]|nr:hypothetical protein [Candidatus Neomarinimicrobiota bacterium]